MQRQKLSVFQAPFSVFLFPHAGESTRRGIEVATLHLCIFAFKKKHILLRTIVLYFLDFIVLAVFFETIFTLPCYKGRITSPSQLGIPTPPKLLYSFKTESSFVCHVGMFFTLCISIPLYILSIKLV